MCCAPWLLEVSSPVAANLQGDEMMMREKPERYVSQSVLDMAMKLDEKIKACQEEVDEIAFRFCDQNHCQQSREAMLRQAGYLILHLAKCGDNIAEVLYILGYKGWTFAASECPLAHLLVDAMMTESAVVSDQGAALKFKGDVTLYPIHCPATVMDFVRRFDMGEFPYLEDTECNWESRVRSQEGGADGAA